mmetsp:Transcript_10886/g.14167  ORF Transcript_10886/g.14167 Transcript_10886/m.14167 type:complete len:275 (+) Transcript_10886:102-926(+)
MKENTSKVSAQGFQLKFDVFPVHLREGPWHPFAYIYITLVLLGLVYIYFGTQLIVPFPHDQHSMFLSDMVTLHPRLVAGVCAMYMTSWLVAMFIYAGPWPMASYTMISWTFLTLRHWARALNAPRIFTEIIRFPAVAGTVVTVVIWWIILVPAISFFAPSDSIRRGFLKFNFSPFLLNVHLINFPLCMIDHALGPRSFVFTDLYIGIIIGMIYLLFYLLVLDAKGFHFYIILSPRTPMCIFSFSLVLFVYVIIWFHWHKLFNFCFSELSYVCSL